MNEKDLERLFSIFLVTAKGYSNTSLLYEASLHPSYDKGNFRQYIADLLILDTEFNNYLALIEFKGKFDNGVLKSAYEQVKGYLSLLNKLNLPAFLVVPSGESDFEIYQFSIDKWVRIEKEDFPQYQM